jgi:hypothetical protein
VITKKKAIKTNGLIQHHELPLFGSAEDSPSASQQTTRELVKLYAPQDADATLKSIDSPATVVMLDPWYNKGIGGQRDDYDEWLAALVATAAKVGDHIYVWGFPEIIWRLLNRLPPELSLVSWLTWYYKNGSSGQCVFFSSGRLAPLSPALQSQRLFNDLRAGERGWG